MKPGRARNLSAGALSVVAASFLFSSSVMRSPGRWLEAAGLEGKVNEYIRPFMDLGGFSGSILIARNGKVLMSRGYGLANYELGVPNTPQTKFQIASLSKPFTAAAILILRDRGQLSTEDKISKFIADYPNGNKITIHHLLAHTSGIPNVNDFPDYNEKSKFPHTLAQIVELFKRKPLEFQPGERYHYSNSDYNLLAYVIEIISGQSYGDYLRKNIFEPLNMGNTGDPRSGEILKNRASGYVPVRLVDLENAPYLDWSIKTGNGSLYSTVEDLYNWDRALYTEKILKKSTLDEMFEKGYGWFVGKRLNRRVTRYSGRSPGFSAELQRYVDEDAFVVVLGNNYAPTTGLIANDLSAMMLGEKYEIPKLVKPPAVDPKILDNYVGDYLGGSDFFLPGVILELKQQRGALYMHGSSGATSELTPQSETSFLDRQFWGMVTFRKDDQGEVTGLVWKYDRSYEAKRKPSK